MKSVAHLCELKSLKEELSSVTAFTAAGRTSNLNISLPGLRLTPVPPCPSGLMTSDTPRL